MIRLPPLLLAGLMAFLAVTPTRAVDLFAFRDAARHVLVFAVPGTEPVPATVDQITATQEALDWARRFYQIRDLDVVDVAFETTPTRFWRVTFSERGRAVSLYAVVLPDGHPVEPTLRDET
ncbi:MAG TPA: hypothetical protein VGD78_13670 [Chthoniobacterales bacterium]